MLRYLLHGSLCVFDSSTSMLNEYLLDLYIFLSLKNLDDKLAKDIYCCHPSYEMSLLRGFFDYFGQPPQWKARCKSCKAVISRPNFGTSNMRNHLERVCKTQFSKLLELEKEESLSLAICSTGAVDANSICTTTQPSLEENDVQESMAPIIHPNDPAPDSFLSSMARPNFSAALSTAVGAITNFSDLRKFFNLPFDPTPYLASPWTNPNCPTPYSDAVLRINGHKPYNPVTSCGKVKRPINAFLVFLCVQKVRVLRAYSDIHQHISVQDFSKFVANCWTNRNMEQRNPYIREAAWLQLLHNKEFPGYKYKPNRKPKSQPQATSTSQSHPLLASMINKMPSNVAFPPYQNRVNLPPNVYFGLSPTGDTVQVINEVVITDSPRPNVTNDTTNIDSQVPMWEDRISPSSSVQVISPEPITPKTPEPMTPKTPEPITPKVSLHSFVFSIQSIKNEPLNQRLISLTKWFKTKTLELRLSLCSFVHPLPTSNQLDEAKSRCTLLKLGMVQPETREEKSNLKQFWYNVKRLKCCNNMPDENNFAKFKSHFDQFHPDLVADGSVGLFLEAAWHYADTLIGDSLSDD